MLNYALQLLIYQEGPHCVLGKILSKEYLPYIPSLRERKRETERDETHNTELRETQKIHFSKLRAIEQKYYQKIMLPLAIEVSKSIITGFPRVLGYGRQSCKLLSHICGSSILMQRKLSILWIFKWCKICCR